MMSLLVSVVAVFTFLATPGVCEKAFVFQGSNELSNVSRALLYLKPKLLETQAPSGGNENPSNEGVYRNTATTKETTVSDISVCVWMKIHYFRQTSSYLFSYATSRNDNNELNFGIKYDQILIAVGGKYLYGIDGFLFIPYTWYHLCFVADSENKTGTFYINGDHHKVVELTRRSILLNGSLVLGQETDQIDGGYQALQSFCGVLTGFNLYSRSLNSSEVLTLASCLPEAEEGDLVSWSKAEWEFYGPVDVEDIQREEYCIPKNFSFVIFPKKRTHDEAQHLCHRLKSTIALPDNSEENTILYKASEPFIDGCQPHNHASIFMWLGTTRNQHGTWTQHSGDPVTYNNFHEAAKRTCAGFKIPPNREHWSDVSCSTTYKFCTACEEEEDPVVLRMRGLCESSVHDTFFRMVDQNDEMPLFRGFTKYNIKYDNNGTWDLFDVWTGNVLAKFFTHSDEIPFGKKNWWTVTNFDICQKSSNKSLQLSLSACYEWEYSCNDGSCINLSQRCDLRVDCPDKSDEVGCEKLWKPTDYLGALPPPGKHPGSALLLNLSLAINGFSEINIRDMKLIVDFTLKIRWSDSRLRYKNLSPLSDLNYIEPTSVWVPKVDLVNADFPKTFTTDPLLNILRLSEPEEDDPSRISRDEVYEGSKNSMVLMQKFNAPFSCTMNMKNFPFDKQHCQLLIRFASAKRDFMEWNDISANYLGEELLAEYLVENVTIHKDADEGYSLVVVGITFRRRHAYYMTSAYLPTVMLMIISFASLFCKKENCDLRVMMALTTLLVLYALYQQISNDLPRTSYTKAIDVWCFFSITFIFSQVILHVFVNRKLKGPSLAFCPCPSSEIKEISVKNNLEVASAKYSSNPDTQGSVQNCQASDITREQRLDKSTPSNCFICKCNLLNHSRIFYLVLFCSFCIIYWSVVLTSE